MPPVFVFVVFNVGSGDLNLGYHACKVGILPTETHYPSLTRLQPLLSDMNKIRVNGAGKMAAIKRENSRIRKEQKQNSHRC